MRTRVPNADGQMIDSAQELAATEPLPMAFNASDQLEDTIVANETRL